MPDGLVDPSSQNLLRRAVSAIAERLEQLLRKLRAAMDDPAEKNKPRSSRRAGRRARPRAYLLGTLRATPKCRMASREARTAVGRAPSARGRSCQREQRHRLHPEAHPQARSIVLAGPSGSQVPSNSGHCSKPEEAAEGYPRSAAHLRRLRRRDQLFLADRFLNKIDPKRSYGAIP
jgi:hypothetical protein